MIRTAMVAQHMYRTRHSLQVIIIIAAMVQDRSKRHIEAETYKRRRSIRVTGPYIDIQQSSSNCGDTV